MDKTPMRIFEGDARPYEPFWRMRNAAETESGEAEMDLYGYISEYSWFEDDVTPRKFRDDLAKADGKPITIRINSPGGDVFAASVIKSALVEYPGQVTMRVDGMAASAATIVLMAGDVIKAQDSAYLMIHDPAALAFGNIDELKKVLDILKTVKAGIVDGYAARTGVDGEKLAKMMAAETWMTAKEAKELGFVDEVITTKTKAPRGTGLKNAAFMNALRNYVNVPAALLDQNAAGESGPEHVADVRPDQQAAERFRAEVKILVSGGRT